MESSHGGRVEDSYRRVRLSPGVSSIGGRGPVQVDGLEGHPAVEVDALRVRCWPKPKVTKLFIALIYKCP